MAHEHGHIRPRELVEGEHALLQDLPDLGVVLLAASLLLGLARVAVVQVHLELAVLDALPDEGADAVLVGELLAVVGELLPPMYFPPFTPMIHNRSRQPAPAGYANVFPPLSAPPSNLSRNARASRARALSEPG